MREQPLGTNKRWARRSIGLLALALPLAGCPSGASLTNLDEHLGNQGCDTPGIFADSCAGSLCHTPRPDGQVTGGVDLVTPGFEAALIDRPSDYSAVADPSTCPAPGTELIIDTQDPEASLIITKTGGGHACGLGMPPVGSLQLSATAIECIRSWAMELATTEGGLGGNGGEGGSP